MKQLAKIFAVATMLALASSALADLNRVGPPVVPSPPGHGFPSWYQDLNGMVLDLCLPTISGADDPQGLQDTACLLEIPRPYTFPTNFPDELFYFRGVSDPLITSADGKRAILVLALEAAFGTGAAAVGQQTVFTRIRVTAGVPFAGDYVVTHPYGTEFFPDVSVGPGSRDIVFSEDIGITPGAFSEALSSRFGPFIQHSDIAPGGPPATPLTLPFDPVVPGSRQFIGDGATGRFITGSPFGTNYFELCGPLPAPVLDALGNVLVAGNPNYGCYRQELFALTGMLRNLEANPIGSPLSVQRATYNRDDSGTRVDVMARASSSPTQGAPRLTVGGAAVAPVLMDGPTILGDWYAQGVPFPDGALPGNVTVTNSGDVPPTSITTHAADEVYVRSAVYDSVATTITVVASSSDKGSTLAGIAPPILALSGFPTAIPESTGNTTDRAEVRLVASGVLVPPAFVRVASSAGGQGTADLAMGASTRIYPPGVPFVADDTIDAVQNGPVVIIPVLDNDVAPAGEPLNVATLTVLAPNANIGRADPTVAPFQGSIAYRPPSTTGVATFRYTVTGTAGTSNVGTVTVNVLPDPAGPVPTAVNDPSAGAINVTSGGSIVINVLANDNANGGTLDPASIVISTPPAVGTGTAVPNPDGTVTFTATTAGTRTFQYTVANVPVVVGGPAQRSAPATVTVTVAAAETLTLDPPRCDRGRWQVRGTSNVSAGNTITIYRGATAGGTAPVIGSVPVVAGAYQFQGNATCSSPISIQSTLGTKIQNRVVQVRN